MNIDATIVSRNDTEANWTSVNPILALGEIGISTDVKKFKVGDGVSTWAQLTYYVTSSGSGVSDYESLTSKPSINSVVLGGNKTSANLGLASTAELTTTNGNVTTVTTKVGNIDTLLSEILGTTDVEQLLDDLNGEVI